MDSMAIRRDGGVPTRIHVASRTAERRVVPRRRFRLDGFAWLERAPTRDGGTCALGSDDLLPAVEPTHPGCSAPHRCAERARIGVPRQGPPCGRAANGANREGRGVVPRRADMSAVARFASAASRMGHRVERQAAGAAPARTHPRSDATPLRGNPAPCSLEAPPRTLSGSRLAHALLDPQRGTRR